MYHHSSMTMIVTHISTVHRWDDVRVLRKECRFLGEAGCNVTLIASREESGHIGATRITALPEFRSRSARAFLGAPTALVAALKVRPTVCHFHDPELLPVGLVLKLLGKKVVYDVHENVSAQILSKHWIPRLLRKPISWFVHGIEQVVARRLDAIVAATPAIAKLFPPEKTVVVQNFPILGELDIKEPIDCKDAKRIAYVGLVSQPRGIHQVMQALEEVADPEVRLDIAGRFASEDLETNIKRAPAWRQVQQHGWCDRTEVAKLLSTAAMGIVTFLPEPNHVEAQPNKLFEYMAAGIPVIASDFPLWREIVEGAGCGLLVDPQNPKAIGGAISWLLANPEEGRAMGRRGRAAVLEKYNWNQEFQVLQKLYQTLLGTHDLSSLGEDSSRCEGDKYQTDTRSAA